jgi:hypothetical protein
MAGSGVDWEVRLVDASATSQCCVDGLRRLVRDADGDVGGSYRPQDVLHISLCDACSDGEKPIVFFVYSSQGRLRLGQRYNDSEFGLLGRNDKAEYLGFSAGKYWLLNFQYVIVPYWFLTVTTGVLAMIFRLRWPLRFTLRGLFIATTFLAVAGSLVDR